MFDELMYGDGLGVILYLDILDDHFFGLDVSDDMLSLLFVDEDEAELKMRDGVHNFLGDGLVLLEHEELLEGSHYFMKSLLGMVHYFVYELDL